jgi:hypothetical protein
VTVAETAGPPDAPNDADTDATLLLASQAFCDASLVQRIVGAPGIPSE